MNGKFYLHYVKPFFDFFIAIVLQVILAPLFLLICLLIRLESKGPAVFRQKRVGLNNKLFTIYKFRTMVLNNDKGFCTDEDPRVTRVGKFLRRLSLDELPQLFNILKGEMSFIGPRPAQKFEDVDYGVKEFQARHVVRPGITGLHQSKYRSNSTIEQKVSMDLLYIDKLSFKLDFLIILWTFKILLSRKNIN